MINWLRSTDFIELLLGMVLVGVVLLVIAILIHTSRQPPPECSYYANRFMKDVPVRCLEYWTNPR